MTDGAQTGAALDAVMRGAQALCRPGRRDRFAVVLAELRRATGADASALLHLDGGALRLGFASGLQPEVRRSALPLDQPRLAALLGHDSPLAFADDDPRPDPWDGLIADAPQGSVHSCMGSALRFDGRELGVLTLDALAPGRFGPKLHAPLTAFAAILSLALRERATLPASSQTSAPASSPEAKGLIGESPGFRQLLRELELVAPTRLPVLILGETGTGKERVAELVHARSPRAGGPLIRLNCATLPSTLAEAELFGHAPGAFTGARGSRRGAFELADGGTLLLDEIGELPLDLQAKLLRTLQSGELRPLGAERPKFVDARVLAATHRDLEAEVAAGRFRADLYHRLAGYCLRVPALRERGDDVLKIAEVIVAREAPALGLRAPALTDSARRFLVEQRWPGNVRELEHALIRASLLAGADGGAEGPRIEAAHFGAPAAAVEPRPAIAAPGQTQAEDLPEDFNFAVDEYRRHLILRALAAHEGNWSAAARAMGLDRSNLHRLGRRLGLKA